MIKVTLLVSEPAPIAMKVTESGGGGPEIPAYQGAYEVTPKMEEQILATNGKRMVDNVTIHTIPVTYTSNPQGGKTVLIG